MDSPSVLDVRVGFLKWIIGGLAGASLAAIMILVTYVYIVEVEAAQFVLTVVLVMGLTAFIYKTEVERQQGEIPEERKAARPKRYSRGNDSPDNEELVRAINAAWPSDAVLPKLR